MTAAICAALDCEHCQDHGGHFQERQIKKTPFLNFWQCKASGHILLCLNLGTTFNFNGSFNKALKKKVEQDQNAIFALIVKARKLSLPVDIQCDVFEKRILPVLLYGCENWGFSNLDHIEVFQWKFLKIILKIKKDTPSCTVYGKSESSPSSCVKEKRTLNLWIRVSEGKRILNCQV